MEKEDSQSDDVLYDGKENTMKKRKIHMEVQDCFAHAQTEEGKQPLSNPLETQMASSAKPTPYLNPRTPRLKSSYHGQSRREASATVSSSQNDSPSFGAKLVDAYHNKIPGGFGSAALLCGTSILPEFIDLQENNISTNQDDTSSGTLQDVTVVTVPMEGSDKSTAFTVINNHDFRSENNQESRDNTGLCNGLSNSNERMTSSNKTFKLNPSPRNSPKNTPSKCNRQQVPPNQQKLTSFFVSSPESRKNSQDAYVYGTTVSSYTPVKKIEGSSVMFTSDNESPNFHSCQKSSPASSSGYSPVKCSLKDYKENVAVKKLFEGQKTLVDNPTLKPGKSLSGSSSSNRFNSRKKSHYIKKEPKTDQLKRMEVDCISSSDDECMSQALDSATTNTFGLLGNGTEQKKIEVEKIDYFSILPTEVMQHIFCHLPMLDLCLNSNRVCKRWNEIISSEKFMPWKKRYHKLKKNVEGSTDEMINILKTNNMRSPSLFLTEIISYMRDIKPVTSSNMTQCLQSLPKYQWAKTLLEERVPQCIVHKEANPWSIITCLVILADSVLEIQDVLNCLTSPTSDCTTQEVLECLYRLAAFLHSFKKLWPKGPFSGFHYRLFYALYLYENASAATLGDLKGTVSGKSGQQCMVRYGCAETSMRLTHEQMRVVNHDCQPGEIAKIVAFAGTGKTTTLVRYTQLRPHKRFLLVVFNKSVCDHAKTKFPRNVDCKTGHALAFAKVGFRYKKAGKFRGNGPTVYSITQTIPNKKGDNLFVRAKFVLDTLNTFLSSADPVPSEDHVPDFRMDEAGNRVPIDPQKRKMYVDDTCYLWNRMKDLEDKNVPISHDGYLKLYQLSRPRLHWNYDCILIDEAQDLTPAISDILLSQTTSKILVGDPHQQIYSFRGAVNSMQTVQASTIFYLTQSFRFGPEIAEIAACCLETLKNEKKKTLVGNGQTCKVLGEQVGQLAVLTRCNFTLFNEAVKRCCHENTDDKVAFVGGTDGFGFGMIMDIYCLLLTPEQRQKERREIEHKLVRSFRSLADLEKYANKTQDNDLLGKIKIVRQHHHNLPGYIDKILKKTIRDTRVADVVLSTAHKSKGLEFSTVHLTDDYVAYIQLQELQQQLMGTPLRLPSEDESNLLYVAVTRAKKALIMSPTLMKLIQRSGEIDKLLKCPICFEHLKTALMISSCSHTFCSLCIRKYLSYKNVCPVCNATTYEADLKNNRLVDDIVQHFMSARGSEWKSGSNLESGAQNKVKKGSKETVPVDKLLAVSSQKNDTAQTDKLCQVSLDKDLVKDSKHQDRERKQHSGRFTRTKSKAQNNKGDKLILDIFSPKRNGRTRAAAIAAATIVISTDEEDFEDCLRNSNLLNLEDKEQLKTRSEEDKDQLKTRSEEDKEQLKTRSEDATTDKPPILHSNVKEAATINKPRESRKRTGQTADHSIAGPSVRSQKGVGDSVSKRVTDVERVREIDVSTDSQGSGTSDKENNKLISDVCEERSEKAIPVLTAMSLDTTESLSLDEEEGHEESAHLDETTDYTGTKMPCPVCGVEVQDQLINRHLDQCLASAEKKSSLRRSTPKRKHMAKLIYNIMSERDLRKKLKEEGLSNKGDKQTLIKRHHNFVLMYNAECDALNPRPVEELIKELEAIEKAKLTGSATNLRQQKVNIEKNSSPATIKNALQTYEKTHKSQFDDLIKAARKNHKNKGKQSHRAKKSLLQSPPGVDGNVTKPVEVATVVIGGSVTQTGSELSVDGNSISTSLPDIAVTSSLFSPKNYQTGSNMGIDRNSTSPPLPDIAMSSLSYCGTNSQAESELGIDRTSSSPNIDTRSSSCHMTNSQTRSNSGSDSHSSTSHSLPNIETSLSGKSKEKTPKKARRKIHTFNITSTPSPTKVAGLGCSPFKSPKVLGDLIVPPSPGKCALFVEDSECGSDAEDLLFQKINSSIDTFSEDDQDDIDRVADWPALSQTTVAKEVEKNTSVPENGEEVEAMPVCATEALASSQRSRHISGLSVESGMSTGSEESSILWVSPPVAMKIGTKRRSERVRAGNEEEDKRPEKHNKKGIQTTNLKRKRSTSSPVDSIAKRIKRRR